MIPDGEDVAVLAGQLADHPVLPGIEVLEFIDENRSPPRANCGRDRAVLEQLGGLEHEHVEVHQIRDLARKRS